MRSGGPSGDASVPSILNGTELTSGHIDIRGITTDDTIVGLDQERGAIVLPVSGGDPIVVDGLADSVTFSGKTVFAFRNFDFVTAIGDLTVWTAANGVVSFTTDATSLVAASDDGTRILVTQGSSSDGTTTDLVLGGSNGLDAGAPVFLRTLARTKGCSPSAAYVETSFVLAYCAPSSTSKTIATVDPTSGDITDIVTDTTGFSVVPSSDTAPARILTVNSSGNLEMTPLSGGSATTLGTGVNGYILSADDTAVLVRSDTEIRRVPFDGSTPTVLVSAGAALLRGVSPDGQYFLYSSALGPRHNYGDLSLASATSAGSPRVLYADLDGSEFSSAFTVDSSRVLYFTNATEQFVGTLKSEPVAGGAVTEHAKNVWTVSAYAGSRVVFNDDYVPVPKRLGRATLRTVDTALSDAPAIIATHAGSTFVMNQAKDHVFFSFDDGTEKSGVYAAPLP